MPEERLTLCLAGHVYFTKGKYSETIPAEMETADIRRVLTRLAEYENACFDDECVEVVDTHAIHVMRGNKTEFPRHDWTPCAEGMPTADEQDFNVMDAKKYLIIVERYDEYYPQIAIYRKVPDGAEWQTLEGHKHRYPAISWQPVDPYNPDHIRDATKKIDQDSLRAEMEKTVR